MIIPVKCFTCGKVLGNKYRYYLKEVQKYSPSIKLNDLEPYPAGVRAQAVLKDGSLVHDFLFAESRRSIHVCNAPSPAATACLSIADNIVSTAIKEFKLKL